MKKQIDVATQTVTFVFEGDIPAIKIAMRDVSPENATYAMLHGFSARIGDNAAIPQKDAKTGAIVKVTEAMRAAEVQALVTHYTSGSKDWSPSSKTRTAPQNPTILAIAAKRGCTYAEAEAHIAATMLAELAE